jgi:hypothetical protein
VWFQRFDAKTKRWQNVTRFSKDAKHTFVVRYRFKKRGLWRVAGNFKPREGFKAARAKTVKFKV